MNRRPAPAGRPRTTARPAPAGAPPRETPPRARARVAAALIGLVALASTGRAQAQLPTDWRPFVRLGYEARIEFFKDPVEVGRRVVHPGTRTKLVARAIVESHGSGTVVSPDGLILTNFHVAQAVLRTDTEGTTDKSGKVVSLRRTTPLNHGVMLVYEPDARDPLRVPTLRYRARFLVSNEELDVAVLRIVANADGSPFTPRDLAAVPLGNPYAIPLLDTLHIAGYPGGGGLTLTPTTAQFSGYTHRAPDARDGSLKTIATVAGGNSGGSALHRGALVSIPTRVSRTDDRGARFGYFHPVTWAAGAFALLAIRDRVPVPALDPAWLRSEHNTDVARTDVFVGGRVVAGLRAAPLAGAEVTLYRADRTWEQIVALNREIGQVLQHLRVWKALDDGRSEEDVARDLEIPLETVRRLAATPVDRTTWSADARLLERGEFFYQRAKTDSDGFFFLTAPRGARVKVAARASGYRDLDDTRELPGGVFHDLGALTMLAPLPLPSAMPGLRPSPLPAPGASRAPWWRSLPPAPTPASAG